MCLHTRWISWNKRDWPLSATRSITTLLLHVCVCIWECTCMREYVCVCPHSFSKGKMCVYVCVWVSVFVCENVGVNVNAYVSVCIVCVCTSMCVSVCESVYRRGIMVLYVYILFVRWWLHMAVKVHVCMCLHRPKVDVRWHLFPLYYFKTNPLPEQEANRLG